MERENLILETIVLSPDDALVADGAGADRFEVCSALQLGGLTPSMGTIRTIRSLSQKPIMCMIRPRQGGMNYQPNAIRVMQSDVEQAVEMGADGLVFAFLTADGDVAVSQCKELIRRAHRASTGKALEMVFHRGFDLTRHPEEALEKIVDLGFDRILTSGKAPNVLEGCSMIRRLIELADERIQILPGGGVDELNAEEILRKTGANQLHAYLPGSAQDVSCLSNPRVYFGEDVSELRYPVVDPERVARLRKTMDRFSRDSLQG